MSYFRLMFVAILMFAVNTIAIDGPTNSVQAEGHFLTTEQVTSLMPGRWSWPGSDAESQTFKKDKSFWTSNQDWRLGKWSVKAGGEICMTHRGGGGTYCYRIQKTDKGHLFVSTDGKQDYLGRKL